MAECWAARLAALPRRLRAPELLGRVSQLLPPLRRTADQMRRYALDWDRANAAALEGNAPLWVVLGDSTAQGVGATAHDAGYVGRVRALLEGRDGRPWRIVNWSRSGARTAEVADVQVPRLASLPRPPDLVTAVVGANDLRHTPEPDLVADVERLIAALPTGALVATLPRGWAEPKARAANAVVRERAPARGLVVADLWARSGPPWRGRYADGFHPNAAGYTAWVAAIAEALDLPPETDPAQPSTAPWHRLRALDPPAKTGRSRPAAPPGRG